MREEFRWRWPGRVELNFVGTTAALIGTAIGVGGSVAGSAIASSGAKKAAKTQSDAATEAARLQKQSADEALAFQKQQYAEQQKLQAPWIESGRTALKGLESFAPFQAPGADFMQDPGYKFRVAEGMKAIERSAAARGGVLSGGTAKAIERFGQDTASQEYGNVYARRAAEYQNAYDQLASRAGFGRSATSDLSASGGATAGRVGGILMDSGARQGGAVQDAGAARASGYVDRGNIWGNAAGWIGNSIADYLRMRQPSAAPTSFTNLWSPSNPGGMLPTGGY